MDRQYYRNPKMVNNKIIGIISRYLSQLADNYIKVEKAILFGSFVKGAQTKDSDIDIALFLSNINETDKFNLQVQLLLLASEIDTRIEPHPFTISDFDAYTPFINEIRNTGVELKINIAA